MYLAQNGKCLICKKEGGKSKHEKLCVDHCHKTDKVRGLLCMTCNTAIGKLPTVELLSEAINYLNTNGSQI